jgi:hypothetical protein
VPGTDNPNRPTGIDLVGGFFCLRAGAAAPIGRCLLAGLIQTVYSGKDVFLKCCKWLEVKEN